MAHKSSCRLRSFGSLVLTVKESQFGYRSVVLAGVETQPIRGDGVASRKGQTILMCRQEFRRQTSNTRTFIQASLCCFVSGGLGRDNATTSKHYDPTIGALADLTIVVGYSVAIRDLQQSLRKNDETGSSHALLSRELLRND